MQPIIFQDDISRLSSSREAAQAGNEFISSCMESKLLDLNVIKSCYIIIGSKKNTECLRKEISEQPLLLCGNIMKEKTTDKYLGEIISTEGLAASVQSTIMDRFGRVFASLIETRAIVQDCRSHVVGGITAGLDIWETAHIPSLLNNCEMWTHISEQSLEKLEELQNTLYRMLLAVPKTTPIASLAWDMGGIKMKFRIILKKLMFLHHLKSLDDSTLAKQVLIVQDTNLLPGLVAECKEYIYKYRLPNILKVTMTHNEWKAKVKNMIKQENEKELKEQILKSKKLEDSDLPEEEFGRKLYLEELDLTSARTKFKFRTKMSQYVKMNYSSSPEYSQDLWRCHSCRTKIDTQAHVLWCPEYSTLREGKSLESDQDLCEYLREVFRIRQKLEIIK